MTSWSRRNDARLLTGGGSYVGDIDHDGQLYLYVVRSSVAHGLIRSVDIAEAAALPGVVRVLTGADLAEVPRIPVRVVEVPGMAKRLQPVLASARVRYVGEPVAVVVAEDPFVAEDAAELVAVDIDPMEAATGPDDSERVPLWDDGSGNVLSEFRAVNGDVDDVFSHADVIVRNRFRVGRMSGIPMETRGLVCSWEGEHLHIWGATKFIQFTRRTVAGFFGIPADLVSCHNVDVGGMFGVRGEVYPEDFLVPWAAKLTGRPVKWVEDRREHLMSINQSRDHRHEIEIAASRSGELLGFRVEGAIDVGAYPRPIGGRLPQNTVGTFPGPYRWRAFRAVCRGVASNKPPSGTMRAPSSFEVIFVMERAVDMVAAELGMDPLELRRRNLIQGDELPLTVEMGPDLAAAHYDSGDYPAQLEQFIERTEFAEAIREVRRRRSAGELVGMGWAMYVDHSGMGREETVRLTLDTTGQFVLGTTATDFGQGLDDMAVSVLSRELDVDASRVEVRSGDSTAHDGGNGTFASRSTIFVGSAARDAAGQVLTEAARRAAVLLGCPPDALARTGTGFSTHGSSVGWKELAPIDVIGCHKMADPTHGFGIALCVASIDAETALPTVERFIVGYDVGSLIDRPSAIGQVKGAAAMGLGGTLLESLKFADDGQPLSTTFMDYLLPTAEEIPDVEAHIFEMGGVPGNPLGVKGVGESGIKGVGAAVANALADAIGGTARLALTELPLRPDAISLLVPLTWPSEVPAATEPAAQAGPSVPAPAAGHQAYSTRRARAAAAVGLAAIAAVIMWRLARRESLLADRIRES